MKKYLIALTVVAFASGSVDARWHLLKRRVHGVASPETTSQPILTAPAPLTMPVPTTTAPKALVGPVKPEATAVAVAHVYDSLDEVNALRARRGMSPYIRDEGLMAGAMNAATYRASYLMFGHTRNDFGFLPAGTSARAAGCAGNSPSYGFMACDIYKNYTYAGAAAVMGRDGRLYCHLFVR